MKLVAFTVYGNNTAKELDTSKPSASNADALIIEVAESMRFFCRYRHRKRTEKGFG